MSLLLTQGNALKIPLADESVHMVCTSPPYWGLRDYGTATWEGGDPKCDHKPDVQPRTKRERNGLTGGLEYMKAQEPNYRDTCGKCGAIRIDNQLGLEPTPEQYVANMVAVFREVRRVLRDDGTCWLNLGDSYARMPSRGVKFEGPNNIIPQMNKNKMRGPEVPQGLKEKDMVGIPWRVAFALQADGWWLRQRYPWVKINPMPESADDRPNSAVEEMFLLSKSARYYFDMEGAKECLAIQRNWRNGDGMLLLDCPTYAYPGSHFATYPPALVEPCIKAGTSERGVCPECGKPWERVVEKPKPPDNVFTKRNAPTDELVCSGSRVEGVMHGHGQKLQDWLNENPAQTLGWRPTCEHDADPVPATVFDPFCGSATTLQVARALGRNGVGLDLSLEYLHLARQRLELDRLDAWGKGKKDGAVVTDLPMFEGLR